MKTEIVDKNFQIRHFCGYSYILMVEKLYALFLQEPVYLSVVLNFDPFFLKFLHDPYPVYVHA